MKQKESENLKENGEVGTPLPEELDFEKFSVLVEYFTKNKEAILEGKMQKVRAKISEFLKKIISESKTDENYNLLFLIQDPDSGDGISRLTLNSIYTALVRDKTKNILLILNSLGGSVEPAYLISKSCREHSNIFCVAVPRQAKSAATLIALGAEKIFMGDISELGPIDPQIRNLPALGLGESLKYLAAISEEYPGSSEMFAKFLAAKLDLQALGYMERVVVSTIDYAKRLLKNKKNLPINGGQIAHKLVREYKDHGFVIDKDEAKSILGDMIQYGTPEYKLSSRIYELLELIKLALWAVTKKEFSFSIVGNPDNFWLSMQESQ